MDTPGKAAHVHISTNLHPRPDLSIKDDYASYKAACLVLHSLLFDSEFYTFSTAYNIYTENGAEFILDSESESELYSLIKALGFIPSTINTLEKLVLVLMCGRVSDNYALADSFNLMRSIYLDYFYRDKKFELYTDLFKGIKYCNSLDLRHQLDKLHLSPELINVLNAIIDSLNLYEPRKVNIEEVMNCDYINKRYYYVFTLADIFKSLQNALARKKKLSEA